MNRHINVKNGFKIQIPRGDYGEFKKAIRHLQYDHDYRFYYNDDGLSFTFWFRNDLHQETKDQLMLWKLMS